MPKNTEIKSIFIIGAGPIVIGQACEFDYSGTQGAKALKEEGYRVILINSNPATIMTDPSIADATYLEPITPEFVEKIIKKERPDAILPTLGGQTALNTTLELAKMGVLEKYNVKLLGANINAINLAEDRGLFKKAMEEIGLECPKSVIVNSVDEAILSFELYVLNNVFNIRNILQSSVKAYLQTSNNDFKNSNEDLHIFYHFVTNSYTREGVKVPDLMGYNSEKKWFETPNYNITNRMTNILQKYPHLIPLPLPAIIRPSLTLGGTGGGVANTFEEFIALVKSGLDASPINQIQIDESLIGWKEYEMEVVRDKNDNAIIVCSIENIDPMGIHTGDSITIAPILTLTDKEYQKMRNASIAILRKIGVETGGSNVQFAVNPVDGRMVVIEMNPRVSRSSALASKATGFPIAKVAAKLAVGYTLNELRNDIACFVPKEFDYIEFKKVMEVITKCKQNGEAKEDYAKYLYQSSLCTSVYGEHCVLESNRCYFRPVEEKDFANWVQLGHENEHNEWTGQYSTVKNSMEENIRKMIDRAFEDAKNGFYQFMIFEKSTNEFIGLLGYRPFQDNLHYGKDDVDFGWAIMKKFQNKGIATEIAKVVMDYAFHNCSFNRLQGTARPENIPSNRIFQKVGMKFFADYQEYENALKKDVTWSLYRMDRDDFKPSHKKIFQYIQSQLESGVSELKLNQQVLPASFEPTIDYIVTKIPKFNFEKFSDIKNPPILGTQMQSIGEVMAIGRSFEESFLKAVHSMEEPWNTLENISIEECKKMLTQRIPNRFFYIFRGLKLGISTQEIIELTQYDKWFIERFYNIYFEMEKIIKIGKMLPQEEKVVLNNKQNYSKINYETLFKAKQLGFRDVYTRMMLGYPAGNKGKHLFKDYRIQNNIRPIFKKVDTCANEFATKTNYFYSTYENGTNEAKALEKKKVIILGSGPNRIGQGIEFDYACVHGAYALREIGIEPIIINCNPETVSTDYDISTRLYFEPVIDEHVMGVIENELEIPCSAKINEVNVSTIFEIYKEAILQDYNFSFTFEGNHIDISSRKDFSKFLSQFISIIIQFGGQTPLKLRDTLFEYAIPILGMQNDTIDICDHREKFTLLLKSLNLKYPTTYEYNSYYSLQKIAIELNYHFIIRPSSVIGGRGMAIITSKEEFDAYEYVSSGIVNELLQDATEFDCDAIRDKNGNVFICGVLEHIEYAGIHSGDSACVLPPYSASITMQKQIEEIAYKIASKLGVIGLINIQFAVKNEEIYIIEANPRCSRTMPFIAKATGFPVIKVATQLMSGKLLQDIPEFINFKYKEKTNQNNFVLRNVPHFAVKEAMFSFEKFLNSDIILGPEMKSTGEVIGISKTLEEAYAKAIIATKYKLPQSGNIFISLQNKDKNSTAINIVKTLQNYGFEFYATEGTKIFLEGNNIQCKKIIKISEGSSSLIDIITGRKVSFIINTTSGIRSVTDSFIIRKAAVTSRILHATTLESASMITQAIAFYNKNPLSLFNNIQNI